MQVYLPLLFVKWLAGSCHILKRKHGMNFLDAAIAAEGEQTRQWQSSNFTNEHEKPVTNTTSMLNNTTFLIFSL